MTGDLVLSPACWLVAELPRPDPPRQGLVDSVLAVAPRLVARGSLTPGARSVVEAVLECARVTGLRTVLRSDLRRSLAGVPAARWIDDDLCWGTVLHELTSATLPAVRLQLPSHLYDALHHMEAGIRSRRQAGADATPESDTGADAGLPEDLPVCPVAVRREIEKQVRLAWLRHIADSIFPRAESDPKP